MNIYQKILSKLSIALFFSTKDSKLVLNEIKQQGNAEYNNVSLVLFKSPKAESLLNFTISQNIETIKLMGTFTFSIQKHEKDKDYQNQVMKSTIDMCKLYKGVRGNFLTRMLMENIKKSMDFVLQCPFKPGAYHLWNYQLHDSAIPTYLLTSDLKFMMELRVQAKIPKVKILVPFFALKFYGEIQKD